MESNPKIYAYILKGAGPQRALTERVTHIIYLFEVLEENFNNNLEPGQLTLKLIKLDETFPDLLREHNLHHSSFYDSGNLYVSVSLPKIPRNFDSDEIRYNVISDLPGNFFTAFSYEEAVKKLTEIVKSNT